MTTDRDDDGALRTAFAELRREDAARTPPFAAIVEREPAPGGAPIPLRGGALAAALLVASVVLGLLVRRPPPPPPPMAATLAWTAPTDFLLRTPGIEVLESVPRFAAPRSLLALDGAAAGLQPFRRSPSP